MSSMQLLVLPAPFCSLPHPFLPPIQFYNFHHFHAQNSVCTTFMHKTLFARVDAFEYFSGRTPLHLSAENGHLETCRLLLQSNADVMAADDK